MAITGIKLSKSPIIEEPASVIEGSASGTIVGYITVSGSNIGHSVLYLNDYTQFTLDNEKLVVSNGIGLNHEADEPVSIPLTIGAYTRNNISSVTQINYAINSVGIYEESGVYYTTFTSPDIIKYLKVGDIITIADNNTLNGNYIVRGIIGSNTIYVNPISELTYNDASISTIDIDNKPYNKITAPLLGQLSVGTQIVITGTTNCDDQYEIRGVVNLNTVYIDLISSYTTEELSATIYRILPTTFSELTYNDASIYIDNTKCYKITAPLLGQLRVGTQILITGTNSYDGQYEIREIVNLNTVYIDSTQTYTEEEEDEEELPAIIYATPAIIYATPANIIGSLYIPYLSVITGVDKLSITSIESEIINDNEYTKVVTYLDHNFHAGDNITITDTKHCDNTFTIAEIGDSNTIYLNPPITTFISRETSGYVYLSDSASHYLNKNDPITITSTLKVNGYYNVFARLTDTNFIIPVLPSYILSDSYEIIAEESYGYVYTSKFESDDIQITIENAIDDSKSIITSVSPITSKINTFPQLTITGTKFTEDGDPIVFLNGVEGSHNYTNPTLIYAIIDQLSAGFYNISNLVFPDGSNILDILNGIRQDINPQSDTSIVFTLVDDLKFGIYDLTVINGYEQTQLQNNPLYEADLVSIKLIRYITDQQVSYSLGNTNCYVKPTIQLVYDTDGASGKYGSIMSVIPANVYMEYLNIYLKHNSNFDWSIGGEVTLDNVKLLAGDLVWLSNQTESTENGIYKVTTGTWTSEVVDSNTFIDLGARAHALIENTDTNTTTCHPNDKKYVMGDQPNDKKYVMGDVSREIVIDQHIKFGKTGFYSITYYILDSFGILSKVIRKVKILTSGVSISPSDEYKITDYSIKTEVDPDLLLLLSGNTTDNSTSTCCTSYTTNN